MYANGERQHIEFETDVPAGRRSFESVLTPERGADGGVLSVLAIVRDITERKQAELRVAALSRSPGRAGGRAHRRTGTREPGVDRGTRCGRFGEPRQEQLSGQHQP